jgi:hypothetical protein
MKRPKPLTGLYKKLTLIYFSDRLLKSPIRPSGRGFPEFTDYTKTFKKGWPDLLAGQPGGAVEFIAL